MAQHSLIVESTNAEKPYKKKLWGRLREFIFHRFAICNIILY